MAISWLCVCVCVMSEKGKKQTKTQSPLVSQFLLEKPSKWIFHDDEFLIAEWDNNWNVFTCPCVYYPPQTAPLVMLMFNCSPLVFFTPLSLSRPITKDAIERLPESVSGFNQIVSCCCLKSYKKKKMSIGFPSLFSRKQNKTKKILKIKKNKIKIWRELITKQHSGTLERGDYICRVVNVISMGKSENKKKKGVRCQTKKGKN